MKILKFSKLEKEGERAIAIVRLALKMLDDSYFSETITLEIHDCCDALSVSPFVGSHRPPGARDGGVRDEQAAHPQGHERAECEHAGASEQLGEPAGQPAAGGGLRGGRSR